MSCSSLKIGPSESPLPSTIPHLMPFHVGYTGPAPISTYFRIRRAPEPTYGRESQPIPSKDAPVESQETSDSQATLVASSSASPTPAPSSIGPTASSATVVDVDMDASTGDVPEYETSHYTSAFRGRSLHGLKVELPKGYVGVVLRAPDSLKAKGVELSKAEEAHTSKTRAKAKSKGSGKRTRGSKRAESPVQVDEDVDEVPAPGDRDEGSVRVLNPTASFSSFMLWHPDIPVDEGRDGYLRSLTEWTRLAAEIHRVDEC
ncbi:ribonuclease H2, subunit C [Lenzites betulinus]|nr:ribonuclease H2, subunit C [Lenzites betulinus]